MNAKMIVTVPIDQIPAKVSELLSNISNKFHELSNTMEYSSRNIGDENDLLNETNNLDNMRKTLTLIDANIEDCYSILKGYIKYKFSLDNNEEEDAASSKE